MTKIRSVAYYFRIEVDNPTQYFVDTVEFFENSIQKKNYCSSRCIFRKCLSRFTLPQIVQQYRIDE